MIIRVLLICLIGISSFAQACQVCGFGQDGSQWAYIATTALLTAVPLALFLGAFLFIKKAYKNQNNERI